MRRTLFPRILLTVGVFVLLLVGVPAFWPAAAQSPQPAPTSLTNRTEGLTLAPTKVERAVKFDVSPPLRATKPIPPSSRREKREVPLLRRPRPGVSSMEAAPEAPVLDPVLQNWVGRLNMPLPGRSFDGVANADNPVLLLPPDPNGAIGPNHYVQLVNVSFQIWNKNGSSLYGPAANNTLWQGFGGVCQDTNQGDPIVLYDHLADRWLMSQFAFYEDPRGNPIGPYYECVAISQTPDPTGAWYRYAFEISDNKMNDYPKLGVWPDGYYMSVNQFLNAQSWAGAGVVAFDRAKMVAGDPSASLVYFDIGAVSGYENYGGMLPSDLDGPTLPPAGSPNYFVEVDDSSWGFPTDQLNIFKFHVDWSNPANSTFTGPTALDVAPFDPSFSCGSYPYRDCIPQPDTSEKLDVIADRLMFRLQYRNFGSRESLVTNHTVDVGGDHAGIRWYEIRDPGGTPFIYQQGTYAPDANHRWMGSIAMDRDGNLSLGYSVSSSTLYPSIRYTGRLASDPLGTMPQGEVTLVAGGGSQQSSYSRWGDYSRMDVDPVDDCTFWYTQEYYQTTSDRDWRTRIGSFRFPSCGLPRADFSASPITGTRPLTVTFANQSVGDYTSLEWDFGDTTTSTITDPVHTYSVAGVYTVALQASGTAGSDAITRTNYITVYEPVAASFSASPISGQAPLTVTFTNQSSGADAWQWSLGDGQSSDKQNPTHVYDSAGTYTVTLTVWGPGGVDSLTKVGFIRVVDVYRLYLPIVLRDSPFTNAQTRAKTALGRHCLPAKSHLPQILLRTSPSTPRWTLLTAERFWNTSVQFNQA